MAIKAIIFDCFGVLILNSGAGLRASFPHVAQELEDLFVRSDNGYMDRDEYVQEICALTGITPEIFQEKFWGNKIRNQGLFEWSQKLRADGYKVGLLSNVFSSGMDDIIPEKERSELFDAVVLSYEIHMQKPDKQVYLEIVSRLGVEPSECVMLDDTQLFVEGAKNAGLHAVQYASNEDARERISSIISEQANA